MVLWLLADLFIGVALFSDIFMGSIEEITSKTKKVRIDGQKVEVKVWNDTVANLSLMALGSSAPEILLSTVELMTSGAVARSAIALCAPPVPHVHGRLPLPVR